VDEPPRRSITRSDEPKLKIGDIVAIKEGVVGMGGVKGFEMFFGFTAGRKLNKIQQLTAYPVRTHYILMRSPFASVIGPEPIPVQAYLGKTHQKLAF